MKEILKKLNKKRVKQHKFDLVLIIVFSVMMSGYLMLEIDRYAHSLEVYVAPPLQFEARTPAVDTNKEIVTAPAETKKKLS